MRPVDDVMDRVGISSTAIDRWTNALAEFAAGPSGAVLRDQEWPGESAHVLEDGCLELRLRVPSGDMVAMKVGASEWCWAKTPDAQH